MKRLFVSLCCLGIASTPVSARRASAPVEMDEATKLLLASAMVAEGDWDSVVDHAAIAHVLARRWRQAQSRHGWSFREMIQRYCTAFDTRIQPNARQRWIRNLGWNGEEPIGWPASASWDPEKWKSVHETVEAFDRGELRDPCPGATHWTGRTDTPGVSWRRIRCSGPTANGFWSGP